MLAVLAALLALDMPAPAPAGTDERSVVLWAIAVLFFAVVVAVLALWRHINATQDKCEKSNQKAWDENAKKEVEIKGLLTGALKETQDLARTAIDEARKNREVLTETNRIIAGIDSGKYRTRHE